MGTGALSIAGGAVFVGTRALSAGDGTSSEEDGAVSGAAGVAVAGINTFGVPNKAVPVSGGSWVHANAAKASAKPTAKSQKSLTLISSSSITSAKRVTG